MKFAKEFLGRWIIVILVLIVGSILLYDHLASAFSPDPQQTRFATPNRVDAAIRNEADLLIDRCGRPDRITAIGGFEPGPLVPQRVFTYKKAHLRLSYIDADPMGTPPPFDWMLSAAFDTSTNHAVDRSTVERRLPCLVDKQR
jgi:hypothetical protein